MSNPVKHHFVPQVYMKRFSFNESDNLFTLKLKSEFQSKIKTNHPAQICYGKNRYRFDNKEMLDKLKIEDPNIIEKSYFEYEEKELSTLFDKIDNQLNLTQSEFKRITQIIVDIKSRNPSFSENYKRKILDSLSMKEVIMKARMQAKVLCDELGYDIKIIEQVEKNIHEKFNDDNYKYNMYLNSFLKESIAKKDVVELLINWKVIVYRTTNEFPVISSDNPGFTLDKGDNIRNTDFFHADAFAFPISPTSVLCYKKESLGKELDEFKDISFLNADNQTIQVFNIAASKLCNNLIFGNSRQQLELMNRYT